MKGRKNERKSEREAVHPPKPKATGFRTDVDRAIQPTWTENHGNQRGEGERGDGDPDPATTRKADPGDHRGLDQPKKKRKKKQDC
jgi:hypothetical protein